MRFSSSFHSYIGKSTIQQKAKRSSSISLRSRPTFWRAAPAKATNLSGPAADEEHGVAVAEAELVADRLGALRADVLGDRAGAFAVVAEEDVAEARLALALRPGIHAVAEGAVAAGRRRDRPDLDLGIGLDLAGEDLEAGAGEMRRSRPAISIGLRRSGLSEPYFLSAST